MSHALLSDIIARNRAGNAAALPSICSAERTVLRAAMLLPEGAGKPLLVEATSNQVNQDGGYTGMRPADFVTYLHQLADECEFPRDALILGGDHLGPQAWRSEPADSAMAKAKTLVAEYVAAGFTKIHLDCSEGTASEAAHLEDDLVAARAAELAVVCEANAPDGDALSYIVGTEVPVPGGGRSDHSGLIPTSPSAAKKTMNVHLQAFDKEPGSRIIGLVVQPGVEFSSTTIDHLPEADTAGLRAVLSSFPGLTYEAHSTDYQRPEAYPRLAHMGFAIHKVGPALTFAYRQALYALDHVLAAVHDTAPKLIQVMERVMTEAPEHWAGHYSGTAAALRVQRHYGYSDRIRYYWPRPEARRAVTALLDDFKTTSVPDPLLLQHFDRAVLDRAEDLPASLDRADRLILASIQHALAPYHFEAAA